MARTSGRSGFARLLSAIRDSFLPKTDNTYDVGSDTKRWKTLYAVLAIVTSLMIGGIYMQEDTPGRLHINGSLYVNGTLEARDLFTTSSATITLETSLNASNKTIIQLQNITMYSPDGTLYDCSLNTSGGFNCIT